MHTLSIPHAKEFVQHVAIDANDPVMLWGEPGVGKSEAMAQLARKNNAVLVDVRLSQYDSVDMRGFPGVNETTDMTVWHPPSTLPFVGNDAFPDDGLTILFFDEFNAASLSVLAVAYQLVNDRRVGEHVLKDNVRIVAAGNREGDKGVTNRMPKPLANRFVHTEVGLDVDAWCQWAQGAGLPIVGIAYMQFRKQHLSTFDPTSTEKAFATPRTWEKALRYYDTATMPDHIKLAAMAGAIGDGTASEFWGFVKVWQSITPIAQIIKDPTGVKLPEEESLKYAMAVAVSGSMTRKTVTPLSVYLNRLAPEFMALAWQLAQQRDPDLIKTPEYVAFAKQFRAVWS